MDILHVFGDYSTPSSPSPSHYQSQLKKDSSKSDETTTKASDQFRKTTPQSSTSETEGKTDKQNKSKLLKPLEPKKPLKQVFKRANSAPLLGRNQERSDD